LGDRTDATIAYDGTGRQIVRRDSISGGEMVFFDDRLIVSKDSPASFSLGNDPDFVSSIGTKVPFLEVYSTDLRHERTIETVDKGNGDALFIEGSGNLADPSNIRSIGVYPGPEVILSSNGRSLLVKEPLGDTVYHYRDGALEAAFSFHAGRYAPPAGSFGVNPSVERGDSYLVRNILDSDRWVFVEAVGAMGSVGTMLVFDRDDSSKGFSATGGPDGKPGLFFDGLAFTPLYVRDGRLVGHISALTIVDNAESLSNPDLKALAARLKEDSNPVLVMVELK
jgi:hypothetical protein